MIELKKKFIKSGIEFEQIFKDDVLVIYQLSKTYDDGYVSKWFEVFKYTVRKPDIYHSDRFEKYPGDEQFGLWAWSCSNKDVVQKVLNREFPTHPMTKVWNA